MIFLWNILTVKFLEMNNILDMYEYIAGILIELTQAYSIKEEISGKSGLK